MNEFDKEYNYLNVESIDTTQQMVGVFGWMFIGLLISAVCAIYVASTPNFVYNIFATNLYWVLFIAEFGLVIALSAMINKLSNITMSIMFILFSIINGLTLSVIFYVFESQSIFLCFIVAAGMFGSMALYGLVTKKDLTTFGAFFTMGLIGLIIASLTNLFLKNAMMDILLSITGIVIFVALTAYDTQKIKSYMLNAQEDRRLIANIKIYGALTLYLDFINIFLKLLRLLGKGKK